MKTQPYGTFYRRMHERAGKDGVLLRLMMEVTYRCNFRCSHCYLPPRYRMECRHKELNTRQVFSLLDQLSDMGCLYLGFTGGEPFMRADFLSILRQARKKGFQIIIYTNGSLIDRPTAEAVGQIKPNKVDITVPAMSRTVFERITGSPGSHARVFKAIEYLLRQGVHVDFKTCVMRSNEEEIDKIQAFARSVGARHRIDPVLSRRLDGSAAPHALWSRKTKSMKIGASYSCQNLKHVALRRQDDRVSEALFSCGVGKNQAAITPYGQLKLCVLLDKPRYEITRGLRGGWKQVKEFAESIKADGVYDCGGCRLRPYCKWCPAQSWLYSNEYTRCVPECRWAAVYAMDQLVKREAARNISGKSARR